MIYRVRECMKSWEFQAIDKYDIIFLKTVQLKAVKEYHVLEDIY